MPFKHCVLVLSGKGGVGKSTVSVQLAFSLARGGLKVGLLDVDLCGPSVPIMTGLQGREVFQSSTGWLPIESTACPGLVVMSIGFLLTNPKEAVMWRGPKKNSIIKQFIDNVSWGDLDILIVDTPPGTSDEHLSVVESLAGLALDGAVLVTTPQGVALNDVRKEHSFCVKLGIPVIGLVENMSGYMCRCGTVTHIFQSGGGRELAAVLQCPLLGSIPIDASVALSGDQGVCVESQNAAVAAALETICAAVRSFCCLKPVAEQ